MAHLFTRKTECSAASESRDIHVNSSNLLALHPHFVLIMLIYSINLEILSRQFPSGFIIRWKADGKLVDRTFFSPYFWLSSFNEISHHFHLFFFAAAAAFYLCRLLLVIHEHNFMIRWRKKRLDSSLHPSLTILLELCCSRR